MPTCNRADLLAYTLDGLRRLERFGMPFEVVISDNLSTDHTAYVVAQRIQATPYVRLLRQPCSVPLAGGVMNAVFNARGKYVIVHADDDSVIPEALVNYVARMELESDLTAVYSDWIAYDDAQGRAIARYFHFRQPAVFGPQDPLGLIHFVLRNVVYPEQAVYRRRALVRSLCPVRRGDYYYHVWMYRLSRLGRVAFELEPFYREHGVIKSELNRGMRANWRMRLQMIGDEMRNELETVLLWALQDASEKQVSPDRLAEFRSLIDHFLDARLDLEIGRATAAKDWLLASELQRRKTLWHGRGSTEEQGRLMNALTVPAALQHVYELYRTLSNVSGVLPRGFRTRCVHDFFAFHYPEVRLLDDGAAASGNGPDRPLIVDKYESSPAAKAEANGFPEYRVSLEWLLESNRVTALPVDLSAL